MRFFPGNFLEGLRKTTKVNSGSANVMECYQLASVLGYKIIREKCKDSKRIGNTSPESCHDVRELEAGEWVPLYSKQDNRRDNTEARTMLLKASLTLQPHVAAQGNRIGESEIWSLNRITAVNSLCLHERQHTFPVSSSYL
jgi:hypothetical protein